MLNYNKIVILCLFLSVFFFSCVENTKDENSNSIISKTENYSDENFKTWITDTLHKIKSFEKNISNIEYIYNYQDSIIEQKVFSINEDTSLFEIIEKYYLEIDPSQNSLKNKTVDKLIALLKDYEELPKVKFILKFSHLLIFENSQKFKKKPSKEEYRDIQMEFDNTVRLYDYIRGRLGSMKEIVKTSQMKNNDESVTEKEINFIWNDTILKKEIISEKITTTKIQ